MALISKLTEIANAIRNKTGKSDLLTLEQMALEIAAIETGGGSGEGGSTDIEDGLITKTLKGAYSNDRITSTGNSAFTAQTGITSIDLPNVKTVGQSSFYICDRLASVNLPKATLIGKEAFNGCTALTEITLLKAEELAQNAFTSCSYLTKIKLPRVTETSSGVFNKCTRLPELILPFVSLDSGSECAECTSLKTIILPSCTQLGYSTSATSATFRKCTGIEALILPGNTVCTLKSAAGVFGTTSASYASSIINGTGYIYVPAALVDTYKAATNWTTFAGQIRAIEDYPDVCAKVLKADGTMKTAEEMAVEMEAE